ncbi:MAG: DMT family transporter [Halobacteriota archaeon]
MAEIAYVAGLLAALFWGTSPVMSKRGLSYGGGPMLVTFIVVGTGFVMLWVSVILLQGVDNFAPDLTLYGYGVFLVGGIVGTVLGRISNYTGISRVGASVNSSVVATNPLFATVLALVFLGEYITLLQAAGIVIVVTGLTVLTASKGGDLTGWKRSDLLFPLFAAFAFGAGNVIRRFGLTVTSAQPIEGLALNETAAFFGIVCFLIARREPFFERLPIRAYGYFVATGVLSVLGLLMLFIGLKNGRVAIVTTLSGTSTLFATLFSYLLLGDLERVTRGVAAGATLVVAGISIITLV